MNKKKKVDRIKKGEASKKEGSKSPSGFSIHWILLIALILFITFIRLRIVSIPLERDEGEYAYMAQLMLKGHPPFELAYNMKYPGTSMMYALVMLLLGQTPSAIHIGLLLVNISSILLLYLIGKKIFNATVGLVASVSFALLTLSTAFTGSAAHATHFVTLFALAGIYLMMFSESAGRKKLTLFLSGICFGASILMKQPGLMLAAFGFLYTTWLQWKTKESIGQWLIHALIMGAGIVLPVALLFIWMSTAGTFDRFWFWTFEYGREYASLVSGADARYLIGLLWKSTFGELGGIWSIAIFGFIGIWSSRFSLSQKFFAIGLFLFGAFAVMPGYYFRGHYFVMLAPAIALFTGAGVYFLQWLIKEKFRLASVQWMAPLLFLLAVLAGVAKMQSYLFEKSPEEISRMIYGGNPFIQSKVIGEYIRKNTAENDRVAVLGSEPQICFYADRISASGYLYTYNLMEPQPFNLQMQEDMISEIEKNNPAMMVFVKSKLSWMQRPESPDSIYKWFEKYVQNFDLTGMVELPSNGTVTHYYWGEEAAQRQPPDDNVIFIFKRKKS